jgi:thermosome
MQSENNNLRFYSEAGGERMAEGQQVLLLREGTQRTRGRDAQSNNITVAKMISESVRSTLGPKGMDKMLVDDLGEITITNDGATILENLAVEHPAAKMLIEVAKAQDAEVGDGTTTAVVFAGELLKSAEELIDQNIHPTVVVNGFKIASENALKFLDDISEKITPAEKAKLIDIATTSMTGKGAEMAMTDLAQIVVDAVLMVADQSGTKFEVDKDNIQIEKKDGGEMSDTALLRGIIVDKERLHSSMPRMVENAKIALVDGALEIKKPETDTKISIMDPSQIQGFLDQEQDILKGMVEKVKSSGANVLFCQKGIDDIAQYYLAKAGIYAVRRVKKSDIEKLSRATGARIVSRFDDLSAKDLGYSKTVKEEKVSGDQMTFVEGCKNPKAVSIFLRGGTQHVVEETERAIEDAIGAVSSAVEQGAVVYGGGAIEIELAVRLRDYAKKIGGREQLAIELFANALEIIPRTLAESAGMDAIDTLVKLRALHKDSTGLWKGINVMDGKIDDMKKLKVTEPLKVKKQAIMSATEVAEMLLRIDDLIAAKKSNMPRGGPGGMPGGMPPGMGGMGGMPGMM